MYQAYRSPRVEATEALETAAQTGLIMYEGKSMLSKQRIVAVATLYSSNSKTATNRKMMLIINKIMNNRTSRTSNHRKIISRQRTSSHKPQKINRRTGQTARTSNKISSNHLRKMISRTSSSNKPTANSLSRMQNNSKRKQSSNSRAKNNKTTTMLSLKIAMREWHRKIMSWMRIRRPCKELNSGSGVFPMTPEVC